MWRTLEWGGRTLESYLAQYTLDQLLPWWEGELDEGARSMRARHLRLVK